MAAVRSNRNLVMEGWAANTLVNLEGLPDDLLHRSGEDTSAAGLRHMGWPYGDAVCTGAA